ncbi:MAG: type II toxin-antitoxin system VapC family toxin [Actinobacteria bacterium]|nr:type II toxin-antitoxin system VapC family toxin [Actinomycetota bacterium]
MMRVLLDTHTFLWSQSSWSRLSGDTQATLIDPQNTVLLSSASAWAIALKYSAGTLELPAPPAEYIRPRMGLSGLSPLTIEHRHTCAVADLPLHHRDPFDRLLIAQATVDRLVIITADEVFRRYDVEVMPA